MTNTYLWSIVEDAEQSLQVAIRAMQGLSGAAMLLEQALLLVQDALVELENDEEEENR